MKTVKNLFNDSIFQYDENLKKAIFDFFLLFPDERKEKYCFSSLAGFDFFEQNLPGLCADYEDFFKCSFENSNLYWAILSECNLEECNFANADLGGAALEGANLRNANLENANLQSALRNGANISGADLSGANLEGANLETVIYDSRTIFPAGFIVPYGIMQLANEGEVVW